MKQSPTREDNIKRRRMVALDARIGDYARYAKRKPNSERDRALERITGEITVLAERTNTKIEILKTKVKRG